MNELPDLSQPVWFVASIAAVFLIVVGRYFLVAGLFHCFFYIWFRQRWVSRTVQKRPMKTGQLKAEITWSMLSALIFAVAGAFTLLMWQQGMTRVYIDPREYSLWWLPASLIVTLFLHESYYYWLHRWMHRPSIFRVVHKVHHDSHITSPWTAFSFHPLESILQSLFLPVVILLIPVNVYVILVLLVIMTFSSVINHLNIEIYSTAFRGHFLGRWLIGATHHSLHHKAHRYNFGLYFNFWDKWRKTEGPDFPGQVIRKNH